ncbi:MAG: virulence RhuM family protein [Methanomassiliicoccaceae archaeon]|nr:virulence RhuM family protein [Methanomassiliicoccaceae archaeon]
MAKNGNRMIVHDEQDKSEIILYQPDDSIKLEVRSEDDTVWLTQVQMAELFQTTKQNVSLHINNMFKECEINSATVKEYLTVQSENGREVSRITKHYNLEVIMSISRRTKSQRGALFCQWATEILEDKITRPSHVENRGEMVLYRPDNSLKLEVKLEDDDVWLNRQQIAFLFGRDVKTIGKHINNALNEELLGLTSVANFATHLEDGRTYQVEHYNLDVILSVGYRVKSQRGIQFRIWSNRVLKEYVLKGYVVDRRFERVEYRVEEVEKKIDFFVKRSLPPDQGIFFEGQIFDAYVFVSDLIRSAKKTIILMDNYVDESVLLLLSNRQPNVDAVIYTKNISAQLRSQIDKHNLQYDSVVVHETSRFHDRFLMIDDAVYHTGSSLKDLGKKLSAYSKIEIDAAEILRLLT